MNTHTTITSCEPAELNRRSFIVGAATAGLALGYASIPGLLGRDEALAAPASFDPSVWYSIGPDGLVTVTCGKADMGQHIASTWRSLSLKSLAHPGRTCAFNLPPTTRNTMIRCSRLRLPA